MEQRHYLLLLITSLFLMMSLNGCGDSATSIEDPPDILFSGTQSAFSGEEFSFVIETEDPQGEEVNVTVAGLPTWLTFFPDEDRLSGTPEEGDEGLYQITVEADNGERARSREMRIRVFKDRDEENLQLGVENAITSHASGLRGVSVALIDRNGDLFHAYTGTSGSGQDLRPVDHNSLFRVASVTKPVTTALVLQLVEEGLFDLDDILEDHIETELPFADRMTIRQMLSHTAGVFDHLNSNNFWSSSSFTPTKVWSVDEIVDFAVDNGPVFSPGTSYRYSNTAFYQLQTLIEETTGLPLKKAYRERIFEPLGLTETIYDDFSTSSDRIENLALNSRSYEYHLTAAGPAGAIAATATDMAAFGRILYGGRLLNTDLTNKLSQNIGEEFDGQNYGLGTRIWEIGGIPHHGHTGALLDYRNIVMYIPEADLTVAIHTHDVHPNWFTLIDAIFDFSVQNFSDGLAKPIPFIYGAEPREESYLH
ncbi:MAG: serine hydrolase [Balneolaceae bacterium]|nr:serine hydrolase [Balneolaceae bacterium]MCH8547711.1 serine hydrolase [Balneolaceae bacterium]